MGHQPLTIKDMHVQPAADFFLVIWALASSLRRGCRGNAPSMHRKTNRPHDHLLLVKMRRGKTKRNAIAKMKDRKDWTRVDASSAEVRIVLHCMMLHWWRSSCALDIYIGHVWRLVDTHHWNHNFQPAAATAVPVARLNTVDSRKVCLVLGVEKFLNHQERPLQPTCRMHAPSYPCEDLTDDSHFSDLQ